MNKIDESYSDRSRLLSPLRLSLKFLRVLHGRLADRGKDPWSAGSRGRACESAVVGRLLSNTRTIHSSFSQAVQSAQGPTFGHHERHQVVKIVSSHHLARTRRPVHNRNIHPPELSKWKIRSGVPSHGCEASRVIVPCLLPFPQSPSNQQHGHRVARIDFSFLWRKDRQAFEGLSKTITSKWKRCREQQDQRPDKAKQVARSNSFNDLRDVIRYQPLRCAQSNTATKSTRTSVTSRHGSTDP